MTAPEPTEIKLVKRRWATEARQVILGVDPGFASTGMVILEREMPGAPIKALWVETIKTKPTPKEIKNAQGIRATNDDQRRYREVVKGLSRIHAQFEPYIMGVEAYVLNPFQKKGVGLNIGGKTMAVYGSVLGWGETVGLFVAAYLPADLKMRFCANKSASKTQVRRALYKQVVGLQELIEAKAKGEHEHLGDAAGHAVLALEETDQMRQMLGLG